MGDVGGEDALAASSRGSGRADGDTAVSRDSDTR